MKPPSFLPVATPRGGSGDGPAKPDPCRAWVKRLAGTLLGLCRLLMQPSLTRRLVLSALLAFMLVGAVLMTSSYLNYRGAVTSHAALLTACRHLGESLAHASDDEQARVLLRATETYFNASRADLMREKGRELQPLLFELIGRDGQRLFASHSLGQARLLGRPDQATSQTLLGRTYWSCQAEVAGRSVVLAEAELPDVTVLSWIWADLLPDLALAFPFVLLPVWLAVYLGLRPLRRLARQLGQRRLDDASPIRPPLRHAELRPLIASFDALLGRLREAMQRERAFVQDAAHELRTPMAVMAAQAHVLVRAGSADERVQAGQALERAIARASHLSAQLLVLASLDEQRAVQAEVVDLTQLCEQALVQAAPLAQDRGIELSLDAPDHLPARLELSAFHSVLNNLLDNALRYIGEGGQIELSLRAETGGGWRLSVADDGPGIAPADQARIFERFARGGGQQVAGTGLGLAIVRQAAQRLGGEVSLRPGLQGRGVAFELRVPGPGVTQGREGR